MAQKWTVVGGADKGGILVREGESIKSEATAERLSTGATIEEIELKGERLHYKLLEGTGPAEGWVGLSVSGKTLVEPVEDIGPPGEPGPVAVDWDLKRQVEARAEEIEKEGKFADYCPKYKVFGGPLEECALRLVCFHNAGGSETQYTGPGPIFKWLKEKPQKVEIIAFDMPGRGKLLKAKMIDNTKAIAEELLAVAYNVLKDGKPYIVWGHSVGTWVGFEWLMAARKVGLDMPKAAFFNAFPAPHMPTKDRKWPKSRKLNDKEMRKALLDWDVGHLGPEGAGKVVFDEAQWAPMYEKQMRGDFPLFDEYKFTHTGAPKFDFPIHSWHMKKEYYNTQPMIEMWKDWTSAEFDHCTLDMGHLTCFYNATMKAEYHTKVLGHIKEHAKEYLNTVG
jgi:surfactin synthase thioesterase subunit